MSEKPKIFLVRGVDRAKPHVFEEYILYASNEEHDAMYYPACVKCGHAFDINYLDLYCLIESMSVDHSAMTAFMVCDDDYKMVTYEQHSSNIASKLTGVTSSRIGFGENEDQQFLERENWLTTEPFLSKLQVTGRCYNAFNTQGESLPKCDHCNAIKDIVWMIIEDTSEILLDYDQWDGADAFRLYGTFNPILTENAVNILNDLGFDNLVLEELHWF